MESVMGAALRLMRSARWVDRLASACVRLRGVGPPVSARLMGRKSFRLVAEEKRLREAVQPVVTRGVR